MKILMMAGEVSGDYQGSFLAEALRAREPRIELFGTGGRHMREAGVEISHETTHLSSVGLLEPVRHLLPLQGVYRNIRSLVRERRPDLVVLIDNQGFNLAVGRALKSAGLPVVYYFPPQIWVAAFLFARSVARISNLVISAFPREADIYRQRYGANAVCYGHPLLDIVRPGEDGADALRRVGLDPAAPVIGLMPGSRTQEIKELGRAMLEAGRIIRGRYPSMQFVLPVASEHARRQLEPLLERSAIAGSVALIDRDVYACLSRCEMVLTCSGTATLELALLKVPMVVAYRLDPFSHRVARLLAMTPYAAMPNVLLGEQVVPEIIQHRITGEHFAERALEFLDQPWRARAARDRLAEIPAHLGAAGAVTRSADRILEEAAKARRPQ